MTGITATSAQPRAASVSKPNPVNLHMRALNDLSRSMRELRSERTSYERAKRYIAAAAATVDALAALDASAAEVGGAA